MNNEKSYKISVPYLIKLGSQNGKFAFAIDVEL